MPTYEYECSKCGHQFEQFQSMRDAPLKTCPKCKGKVKRLVGRGAGLIFKGSGFYQTDYRSSSYTSGASADKPAPISDKPASGTDKPAASTDKGSAKK